MTKKATTYNGEKIDSSISSAGKTVSSDLNASLSCLSPSPNMPTIRVFFSLQKPSFKMTLTVKPSKWASPPWSGERSFCGALTALCSHTWVTVLGSLVGSLHTLSDSVLLQDSDLSYFIVFLSTT